MYRRASVLSGQGGLKGRNGIRLLLGFVLATCPLAKPSYAYDGPTFAQGLWLFQRSTEFITRHWILPNAKRVKVEAPLLRCVNPTEAMVETFRQVTIGSCHSTLPNRKNNTFIFAKRCDYLGPVKTVISVESEAAYRETNELLVGVPAKKDIVIARRVGDCNSTSLNVANVGDGNLPQSAVESLASDNAAEDILESEEPTTSIHPTGRR
jgi:hypothetical protein